MPTCTPRYLQWSPLARTGIPLRLSGGSCSHRPKGMAIDFVIFTRRPETMGNRSKIFKTSSVFLLSSRYTAVSSTKPDLSSFAVCLKCDTS
ncbi:hypothetical protein Plhal703r1_c06g0033401 [Plasmopara halstedii]